MKASDIQIGQVAVLIRRIDTDESLTLADACDATTQILPRYGTAQPGVQWITQGPDDTLLVCCSSEGARSALVDNLGVPLKELGYELIIPPTN
jgi:hypothetical protein